MNFVKKYTTTLLIFLVLFLLDITISNHGEVLYKIVETWGHYSLKKYLLFSFLVLNYFFQLFLIALLITSKTKIVRWIGYLILLLTLGTYVSYYFLNGLGFSYNDANIVVSEFGMAQDALSNYATVIGKSILSVLVLIFFLVFISKKYKNQMNPVLLMFVLVAAVFGYSKMKTIGIADNYFAIPFQVPADLYDAIRNPVYSGQKLKVNRDSNGSKSDKIVFVVDESIGGSRLQLNGFDQETTPFLVSKKTKIINYGIASSGANCSATSNTILRSGIMPDMFPDKEQKSLKMPNIWAYAKKAGYYTVYIDNQEGKQKPPNYMNKHDLESIDKYIIVNKQHEKMFHNDYKALQYLKEELAAHKKVFVYMNKAGAHFPYQLMYPRDKERRFVPDLEIGESPSLDKKDKVLNSYFNAIVWSVDLWWKALFEMLDDKDVVVLYTSDHGQNIFDNKSPATHCTSNPLTIEGDVPLFLVGFGKMDQMLRKYAQMNLDVNYNHTSHFNIDPTLLFLMGYPLNEDEKTLFDNLSDQARFFYSGDIFERIPAKKNIFQLDKVQ